MQEAEFTDRDGEIVVVDVIRGGQKETRIRLPNGDVQLKETAVLQFKEPEPACSLVVPQTPLRRLYQAATGFKGDTKCRFDLLRERLESRHGPTNSRFLTELFVRSRAAMEFYENEQAQFHDERRTETRKKDPDAQKLVDCFRPDKQPSSVSFDRECPTLEYVDREVCPTRTIKSCLETGVAATKSGSGGVDLLLLAGGHSSLPAVGEIKAASEMVGPTYALIQALTYAAELTTRSQWRRLGNAYSSLQNICTNDTAPRLDVILLIQTPQKSKTKMAEDYDYADQLARGLLSDERVASAVRGVEFLSWWLERDTAIIARA